MWTELRGHREGDQKKTSGVGMVKKVWYRDQEDMGGGGLGLVIKTYSSNSLPIVHCEIAT